MKIMSLNVNRFRPIGGLFAETKTREIIALVKKFLSADSDNVVFLQEIPDKYCKNDSELIAALKPYEMIVAENAEGKGQNIRTVVIVDAKNTRNARNRWQQIYVFSKENEEVVCRNRYVELILQNEDGSFGLRLLGVHSPLEKSKREMPNEAKREEWNRAVLSFFKALKKYALQDHQKENVIIFGDLNTHQKMKGKDTLYWPQIEEIVKNGYSDKVDEGVVTNFTHKTTVDHVLVSPTLKGKVTAQVIPQEILELSDHAVIIVNVDL